MINGVDWVYYIIYYIFFMDSWEPYIWGLNWWNVLVLFYQIFLLQTYNSAVLILLPTNGQFRVVLMLLCRYLLCKAVLLLHTGDPKSAVHNCSRQHFDFFFLFFKENKSLHYMRIVCQADDSHEMSRFIFSEKKKVSSATNFAWHFKG